MDKSKESNITLEKRQQIKRAFKRVLNQFSKEIKSNSGLWKAEVESVIVDATAGQLLKEVTIRTYVQ
jgi:hypothetical protein